MSYTFDYRIRTQPTASAGTAVLDYFSEFRVPGLYEMAARRGGTYRIPFRDGSYQPVVDEYFDSPALMTDGFLKRSTSGSTGIGGHLHVLSNHEEWWQAINVPTSTLWLGWNHPVHGRVERRVRPMGRPVVMEAPWRIRTVFHCVDAFWREETDSTGNSGTFTVTGTAPSANGTLLWTGTTGTVTHTASSDTLTLTASPSTAGILFNMDTKTVTKSSDGSAFTGYEVNSARWLRMNPGSNTLSATAGVTVQYDYYPQHR